MDLLMVLKTLLGLFLIVVSILLSFPVSVLLLFSYDSPYQTWTNTFVRALILAVPISLFLLGKYLIS